MKHWLDSLSQCCLWQSCIDDSHTLRAGIQVNEEEDRRRLKEKLKEALESARRNTQLSDESEGQVLLESDRGPLDV